jgi:hypothetical protein
LFGGREFHTPHPSIRKRPYFQVGYKITGSPRCLMEVAATSAFRYATPEALDRALSDIGMTNSPRFHEKVATVIQAHKATWQWSEVDVAEALLQVLPGEKKVPARRAVPEQLCEQSKTVWADLVALSATAAEQAAVEATDSGVAAGDSAEFEVTPAFCDALQFARTGPGHKQKAPPRASRACKKARCQPPTPSNTFAHLALGVSILSLDSDEELPPAVCPGASAVEVVAFARDEATVIISDAEDIVPHPTGPPVAEAGHSASEALLDIVPHPTGPPVAEAGHSASESLLESMPDLAVEVPAPLSTEGFVDDRSPSFCIGCPSFCIGGSLPALAEALPSASDGPYLESVVGSDVPLMPIGASAVEATTTEDSVVEMDMKGPDSAGYFTQGTSQRKWARITPTFGSSCAVKCYNHVNCSIAMAEWKLPSLLQLRAWAGSGGTQTREAHQASIQVLRDQAVPSGRTRQGLIDEAAALDVP